MLHIPRSLRLALIATTLIVLPTLYVLHRNSEHFPSPGEVQAGGIDGPHWRRPIEPTLEQDYVRDVGVDVDVEELQANERGNWRAKYEDERARARGGRNKAGAQMQLPVEGGAGQWEASGSGLEDTIAGGVIMPQLGNATAKAELGRAAWRVLHLMTLRYPESPTEDDRQALKSYFHLFSRLYPCGECGEEFQKLLKQYPPQTSSRKSASLWLCHVHNVVNARLGKAEFDCLTLDETYDCGCGPEGASGNGSSGSEVSTGAAAGAEFGVVDGEATSESESEGVGENSGADAWAESGETLGGDA